MRISYCWIIFVVMPVVLILNTSKVGVCLVFIFIPACGIKGYFLSVEGPICCLITHKASEIIVDVEALTDFAVVRSIFIDDGLIWGERIFIVHVTGLDERRDLVLGAVVRKRYKHTFSVCMS